MRTFHLAVLMLVLSGSAALAMPGATVGLPLGSPDPFGTMRRNGEPPAAEAALDDTQRRIRRSAKTPRPSRRAPRTRR